nr:hypothetical protein Q903MT_gene1697 [Picea sitchensis]
MLYLLSMSELPIQHRSLFFFNERLPSTHPYESLCQSQAPFDNGEWEDGRCVSNQQGAKEVGGWS